LLKVVFTGLDVSRTRNRLVTSPTGPLHPQCTNRQKQSKDSQNSKTDHWCTNRHRSIKTVPTNSVPIVKNRQKQLKDSQNSTKMTIGVPIVTCLHRVRRIHKSPRPCTRRRGRPRPPNTQSRLSVPTVLPSSEWK